jgi:hypothetical protein
VLLEKRCNEPDVLLLSVSDWSIVMISPGGLLLVVGLSQWSIVMIGPGGLLLVVGLCQWSIVMIGPGGLLLVVSQLFAVPVLVLWV